MVKPFARGNKGILIIQLVHAKWCGYGRWKDYKVLQGVTGHALAQITEQDLPRIDNNTSIRAPDVTYTWREEAQRSKQNSNAPSEGNVKLYLILLSLLCQSSLSWSNIIKLQSPMWVSCSPPIARVQQRLVVNLVDVPCTSNKRWITHECYPQG